MECAGPVAEHTVGCSQGHSSFVGLCSERQGQRILEACPGGGQQALAFEAEAGK